MQVELASVPSERDCEVENVPTPPGPQPPPRGLLVAILGPDGAGKSTLIGLLQQELERQGVPCRRQHVRPRLLGRRDDPNSNPHAGRPHGWLASIAKLAYLALDYLAGYRTITRPALRAGVVWLSDRYFDDLLIDPQRHHYAGPMWMVRAVAPVIPEPDLRLVLDAPAGVIRKRKWEVTLRECKRQLDAYRALGHAHPHAHVLDATQPPAVLARQACALVQQRLTQATPSRPAPSSTHPAE